MLVKTYASALHGIHATTVTVEVDISPGINFFMVGLPDSAVKESQRRIESALKVNGLEITKKRTVINLAPADIRKEGSAYDLPLAIAILAASGTLPLDKLAQYIMMGELSLDGNLERIKGALPMAINARDEGFRGIILPKQNAKEAGVISGLEVYGMENIRQVVTFLRDQYHVKPVRVDLKKIFHQQTNHFGLDFSEVKGQSRVKRALEIAAAGSHNLLMIGPPGAGKTMLARRLPTILPPLSLNEALATTMIHSVAGKLDRKEPLIIRRPFRDPHHTISDTALVGGGSYPQPGEISLAHNGVLYMDELPEFRRNVLEVLRQPMEGRMMTISRAKFSIEYPASFMLVASMNPCPCGYYNHPDRECECPPGAVKKYLSRISGPLLDRIDIQIEVMPVPFTKLSEQQPAESSKTIRDRVLSASIIQQQRFKENPDIYCNAQIPPKLLHQICQPDNTGISLLKNAMEKLDLSARAYDRILKVARTIADLDSSAPVRSYHLAEAINYRNLDREGWGG
ncbi:MAG: magnesium chelatase [Bacteroides sp. SM23_62]|nr:MAG: magnesium chelatase [Bacteroides sp. SM23_62]